MRLSEVILGSGARQVAGPADLEITRVVHDSRQAEPGALFVALPGARTDGTRFALDAVARGAVAVIAERPLKLPETVASLVAPRARRALAECAANLHGRPAGKLALLGVTGTNGKTTTAYLVEAMAAAAGLSAGVVGTVEYRYAGRRIAAPHTTPEADVLQGLLADMAAAGVQVVAMEVSSHALDQDRVAACAFAAAAFTNLTRDHLDYHGTLDAYFAAKARLFRELLAPDGVAVINVDDPRGAALAGELRAAGRSVWTFSTKPPGERPVIPSRRARLTIFGGERQEALELMSQELTVEDLSCTLEGIRFRLVSPLGLCDLSSPLVGAHNVENLLAAAGLALAAGMPLSAVAAGAQALARVPGRLDRVERGGRMVFVDYAHTDDALRRALAALRALGPRRLMVVFGCGGDRDRGKRPLMGRAAAEGADLVVVTSDNPRGEDPLSILGEIVPGLEGGGKGPVTPEDAERGVAGYVIEPDRRAAIRLAVRVAQPGDVVLVAGKGHEDYQIIGERKVHFDDREEARAALEEAAA